MILSIIWWWQVLLTKKEHALVTSYSKKHDVFNYEVYELLGIEINGLSKFLEDKTFWCEIIF